MCANDGMFGTRRFLRAFAVHLREAFRKLDRLRQRVHRVRTANEQQRHSAGVHAIRNVVHGGRDIETIFRDDPPDSQEEPEP